MLAYPDHKLHNVEVTKTVDLKDLLNFGAITGVENKLVVSEGSKQIEMVEDGDGTLMPGNSQSIIDSNFEQCRNKLCCF